ncbi:methionyl-tRNA synthetase [Coemansia sp. Benny D115]|nr:methionyl-tRNA synthetase [Coemansia sp. Benny D115]
MHARIRLRLLDALARSQHQRTATRPLARLFASSPPARRQADSTFYVTQPIFYVNAKPHIGHLYTVVLSDTLKRYGDLQGKRTKLTAGTDEHGLKIQQAAERAKMQPLEFCTAVSDRFRKLQIAATASSTDFIRTTDAKHRKAVEHFWNTLVEQGHIYKGSHSGWYAVSDECFYTDKQIEERVDPVTGVRAKYAIESGQPVEWVAETNYKFRLSAFRDRLIEWLETCPGAVYPEPRRNEVLAWLRAGLEDLSISRPRSRLQWGIPVPNDPEHTIYVWVDALVNYATADSYPWSAQQAPAFFPPDVQVIGKDIVRFHAVYWPAMLMAAGLPLPRRILAHAHWTMGAQKMSKSKGNVVDPFEAIDRYGADSLRYYMVRNGGIADDGDYSADEVLVRYRKDLVGQLANLAARCLSPRLAPDLPAFASIAAQQLDTATVDVRDLDLQRTLQELPDAVRAHYDSAEFGRGLYLVFEALAQANRYVSTNEPWAIVKKSDPESNERLQVVLFYALESVRQAAIMLLPVMPEKAARLLDHLAISTSARLWTNTQFGSGWQYADGEAVSRPTENVATLFPKLPDTAPAK